MFKCCRDRTNIENQKEQDDLEDSENQRLNGKFRLKSKPTVRNYIRSHIIKVYREVALILKSTNSPLYK
jgi:hypothetical protein